MRKKKPVRVGIVDYGMGNLHSVSKAFAREGAQVLISDKPSQLKNSSLLVVPGVGAFGAAMTTLVEKGWDKFIGDWVADGKPYVGICLGYQILFERSEENPGVRGLGIFKGDVVRFNEKSLKKKKLPIPHMGWNTLKQVSPEKSVMNQISPGSYFYFVHSFYPKPKDGKIVFTETEYGSKFPSSIKSGNLFASQFHPEKSGKWGLRLIRNIINNLNGGSHQ